MGKTIRPAPDGDGTYAVLDGDNQLDGIVTADNMLYKEYQLGKENIQNYAIHNADFTNPTWVPTNITRTPDTISKTAAGDGRISAFFNDTPDLLGKEVALIVKCTALSEEGQRVEIRLNDFGFVGSAAYNLQKDVETTLRLYPAVLPQSHMSIQITNEFGEIGTEPWAVSFSEIILREKMPVALANFGDSIAKHADIDFVQYDADCYSARYAEKYQIEMVNYGVSSGRLSWSLVEIQDSTDPSQQIPIIMVHAGLNDILLDSSEGVNPVPAMIGTVNQIIAESKTVSAKIVIFTIPPVVGTALPNPANEWHAWMEAYRLEYNTLLLTLATDTVKIVNLDLYITSAIDPDNFSEDGIHPTPNGHLKYITGLEATFDFPRHIDTYGYVEVWDKDIANYSDLTDKLTTENNLRTIIETEAITTSDGTVLIDCSSEIVTATLPIVDTTPKATTSPNRKQIMRFKCVDALAGDAIVNGNGPLIDGAATVSLALNESLTIQYDGDEWRIL